ncbi:flavin-dependent oxidoreductase [Micrococcaceae bacterium Sec5.8]
MTTPMMALRQDRRLGTDAGHQHQPRVSVGRSVLPTVDDGDRRYFGLSALREKRDQVCVIDGMVARFGWSHVGEADAIAGNWLPTPPSGPPTLLLLTVPNQLGVDFNDKLMGTVVRDIAPAVGWAPASARA